MFKNFTRQEKVFSTVLVICVLIAILNKLI